MGKKFWNLRSYLRFTFPIWKSFLKFLFRKNVAKCLIWFEKRNGWLCLLRIPTSFLIAKSYKLIVGHSLIDPRNSYRIHKYMLERDLKSNLSCKKWLTKKAVKSQVGTSTSGIVTELDAWLCLLAAHWRRLLKAVGVNFFGWNPTFHVGNLDSVLGSVSDYCWNTGRSQVSINVYPSLWLSAGKMVVFVGW